MARRLFGVQFCGFFRRWFAYVESQERTRVKAGKRADDPRAVAVPDDLDWFIFRVLTDERVSVSWGDLQAMHLTDLLDYHVALDVRDEAAERANRPPADAPPPARPRARRGR
jgi:hypothetical protein